MPEGGPPPTPTEGKPGALRGLKTFEAHDLEKLNFDNPEGAGSPGVTPAEPAATPVKTVEATVAAPDAPDAPVDDAPAKTPADSELPTAGSAGQWSPSEDGNATAAPAAADAAPIAGGGDRNGGDAGQTQIQSDDSPPTDYRSDQTLSTEPIRISDEEVIEAIRQWIEGAKTGDTAAAQKLRNVGPELTDTIQDRLEEAGLPRDITSVIPPQATSDNNAEPATDVQAGHAKTDVDNAPTIADLALAAAGGDEEAARAFAQKTRGKTFIEILSEIKGQLNPREVQALLQGHSIPAPEPPAATQAPPTPDTVNRERRLRTKPTRADFLRKKAAEIKAPLVQKVGQLAGLNEDQLKKLATAVTQFNREEVERILGESRIDDQQLAHHLIDAATSLLDFKKPGFNLLKTKYHLARAVVRKVRMGADKRFGEVRMETGIRLTKELSHATVAVGAGAGIQAISNWAGIDSHLTSDYLRLLRFYGPLSSGLTTLLPYMEAKSENVRKIVERGQRFPRAAKIAHKLANKAAWMSIGAGLVGAPEHPAPTAHLEPIQPTDEPAYSTQPTATTDADQSPVEIHRVGSPDLTPHEVYLPDAHKGELAADAYPAPQGDTGDSTIHHVHLPAIENNPDQSAEASVSATGTPTDHPTETATSTEHPTNTPSATAEPTTSPIHEPSAPAAGRTTGSEPAVTVPHIEPAHAMTDEELHKAFEHFKDAGHVEAGSSYYREGYQLWDSIAQQFGLSDDAHKLLAHSTQLVTQDMGPLHPGDVIDYNDPVRMQNLGQTLLNSVAHDRSVLAAGGELELKGLTEDDFIKLERIARMLLEMGGK